MAMMMASQEFNPNSTLYAQIKMIFPHHNRSPSFLLAERANRFYVYDSDRFGLVGNYFWACSSNEETEILLLLKDIR